MNFDGQYNFLRDFIIQKINRLLFVQLNAIYDTDMI